MALMAGGDDGSGRGGGQLRLRHMMIVGAVVKYRRVERRVAAGVKHPPHAIVVVASDDCPPTTNAFFSPSFRLLSTLFLSLSLSPRDRPAGYAVARRRRCTRRDNPVPDYGFFVARLNEPNIGATGCYNKNTCQPPSARRLRSQESTTNNRLNAKKLIRYSLNMP